MATSRPVPPRLRAQANSPDASSFETKISVKPELVRLCVAIEGSTSAVPSNRPVVYTLPKGPKAML